MTGVTYRIDAHPGNAELFTLRRDAWGEQEQEEVDWTPVLSRSLGHLTAHAGGQLVGFVNVAWDGGAHAFLLDTTVHPGWQRRGIGTALVGRAADLSRERGASWLHVDFEPRLSGFYRGCGFRNTAAGVMRLGVGSGE